MFSITGGADADTTVGGCETLAMEVAVVSTTTALDVGGCAVLVRTTDCIGGDGVKGPGIVSGHRVNCC